MRVGGNHEQALASGRSGSGWIGSVDTTYALRNVLYSDFRRFCSYAQLNAWRSILQGPVVISLNEEALTERIAQAGERVCFVSPGLYDWVAEALVDVAGRIGRERVNVVIDPDSFVIRAGYGTENALNKVYASGLNVHRPPA